MNQESTMSRILGSAYDALNPFSIILRIIVGFVFIIMSAFPYLIKYGDEAFMKVSGATLGIKIISFFKVLSLSSMKGMIIGFSTVWSSFLNLSDVLNNKMYMTLFYVIIIIFAGTFVIYQPMSIFFNILDSKKGKHYSKALAFLVSLVLLLVIVSPISYLASDGQTITSGIEIEEPFEGIEANTTIIEAIVDNSNIIDMVVSDEEV